MSEVARFLKAFNPRTEALLERLYKAADLNEGPMNVGDLDIIAWNY
jgi:hypothetical protein